MDYWERRAALRQETVDTTCEALMREVRKIFNETEAEATSKTIGILNTYQSAFRLSETEAKAFLSKTLTPKEQAKLELVVRNMPDCPLRRKYMARLSSGAYRFRIDAEEALKMNVQAIYAQAARQELDIVYPKLLGLYDETMLRTHFDIQHKLGIGYKIGTVNRRQAETVLRTVWEGDSFSSRLWANNAEIANKVSEVMLKLATTGEVGMNQFNKIAYDATIDGLNYGKLEKHLDGMIGRYGYAEGVKKFEKATGLDQGEMMDIRIRARKNADRLISTEGNYLAGQANLNAYEEAGIKKYQFSAILDSKTCSKNNHGHSCAELDQQVFLLSEQKVGVNMHPLHPWCRCTDKPYFDGLSMAGIQRSASDGKGGVRHVPVGMNYEKWKKWVEAGQQGDPAEWLKAH